MSLVFSRFGSKFIPMVSSIATITMLAVSATAQDGSSENRFERFKVPGVRPKPAKPEPPAPSNFPSMTFSPTAQTSAVMESLADVIERCEKSVVRIEVTSDAGSSQGSGFVIDSGIIATNVHVLAGARSATAVFPDQTTCTIDQILAIDERKDIAIARISGSSIDQRPILAFADGTPRKGERVVALGSPLGLSFTATSGVISALRPAAELSREIGQDDLDGNWVQVDAALSPGNSGGPIVDERGAVVAMSTLASQGAQNLNFGISAPDIRQLLSTAKNNTPLSLASGVGHLGEKTSRGGGGGGGGVAESAPVPKTALEAYVAKGVSDFDQIKQNLGKEIKRLGDSLRELRRVRTQSFGDKMVKDEVIDVIVDRMKELRTIDTQLTTAEDTTGLFSLLTKFGPKLDTRFKESIGFMSGGVVLQAYDAHTALVIYEDVPYLMYMETTAGLSTGRELLPCPVYVNGTATAVSPEGRTISVTLLQTVPEIELRPVVDERRLAGESAIADAEFRNWSDKSGRFSTDAILVEVTKSEVVLRTREGKFLRVPIEKLSDGDRKLLGK